MRADGRGQAPVGRAGARPASGAPLRRRAFAAAVRASAGGRSGEGEHAGAGGALCGGARPRGGGWALAFAAAAAIETPGARWRGRGRDARTHAPARRRPRPAAPHALPPTDAPAAPAAPTRRGALLAGGAAAAVALLPALPAALLPPPARAAEGAGAVGAPAAGFKSFQDATLAYAFNYPVETTTGEKLQLVRGPLERRPAPLPCRACMLAGKAAPPLPRRPAGYAPVGPPVRPYPYTPPPTRR
jgi:hypothetical protein